jgi:hypothetical protein
MGVSLPICGNIRNRRLYTFPRHTKKGSRERVDSGEGYPFPAEFTALRILSRPVVVEQSFLSSNLTDTAALQ